MTDDMCVYVYNVCKIYEMRKIMHDDQRRQKEGDYFENTGTFHSLFFNI